MPIESNINTKRFNNNRNGKFRGNNRGRGRGRNVPHNNQNRGNVFTRVGAGLSHPQEGKTVLINPHFRGNVQVNSDGKILF